MKEKDTGNNKGVILLDQNRLFFFVEGQKEPVGLEFNSQIFQHFEILKNSDFRAQIDQFIQQNGLPPSRIYILLSQTLLFQSDFDLKKEGIEEEKKHFLNIVPFENVGSLTLSPSGVERVIAANHDHYSMVREVFEARGFTVEAIAPSQILGDSFAQVQSIDASLVKAVFGNETLLKKNNFLAFQTPHENQIETPVPETTQNNSFWVSHKKIILLLSVFGVLLLILGVVSYFSLFHNKEELQPLPEAQDTQGAVAAPTSIPEDTTPPVTDAADPEETLAAEDINIQILNGSGVTGEGESLSQLLQEQGFTQISVNDTESFSSVTQVVYHPRVPTSIRADIERELVGIYGDVSTSENSTSSTDVVITTSSVNEEE